MSKGRPVVKDYGFMEDKYVKSWLAGLAAKSQSNYRKQFGEVLAFVGMPPTEMIEKRVKDLTSQDLNERQSFELKFREFKARLEETKATHSSVLAYLKCYASFFARNGVKLNLRRGDWMSTKPQKVIKHYTPTLEEVKRLYVHAGVRDKGLLLTLSQSGFSEVDAASFNIEDLPKLYETPEAEHYFMEKPREKTNIVQATCISSEAIHDLKEYLAERGSPKEGPLFTVETFGKGERMTVRAVNAAMKVLFTKTFGAEKAKEFKTKSLRSFYNSALLRADIKSEVKDLMMGHERASARKNYAYDEQTVREAYAHAFPFLSINGVQVKQDFAKFRGEINTTVTQLTKIIADQQRKIDEMTAEWQDIKARLTPEQRAEFTRGHLRLTKKRGK
jgi:integrase